MELSQMKRSGRFRQYLPSIVSLILVNVILAGSKIAIGYFGDSSALRSDGWNNFADFIYTLLLAVGIWISTKPPDDSHPKGHGRFESLIGLVVSLVIVATGLYVIWDSVMSFLYPLDLEIGQLGVFVVSVSIIAKGVIAWFLRNEGERLNSTSLSSIGLDQAGDILADVSVLVAIVAGYYNLPLLDPIVAFVIGLLILRIAWEPLRNSINQLTGRAASQELVEDITSIVESYSEFEELKETKAQYLGPSIQVSLTIKAPPEMVLRELYRVEGKLIDELTSLESVSEVCVNYEPDE